MKWYKKQLDKLKATNPELKALIAEDSIRPSAKSTFDPKKNTGRKSGHSPVAASKLQRSKTDVG